MKISLMSAHLKLLNPLITSRQPGLKSCHHLFHLDLPLLPSLRSFLNVSDQKTLSRF